MISDPNKTVTIKVGDRLIPVWTYGNPKNPPIIFLHGLFRGFSDYIGDLPIRHLMRNYYVICFDLPGFGFSKEIKMENLDFISIIQNGVIGNKKAVLFGVSYGGLLSLKYAAKYPAKVNKIIIAGTPVFYGLFNVLKVFRFLPSYEGKKLTKEIFNEFSFINRKSLSKIFVPVLLYYNNADYVANVFMGKKLHQMMNDSKLFVGKGQNHKWLLHRIDKNGFLDEVSYFINRS